MELVHDVTIQRIAHSHRRGTQNHREEVARTISDVGQRTRQHRVVHRGQSCPSTKSACKCSERDLFQRITIGKDQALSEVAELSNGVLVTTPNLVQ